MNQTGPAMYPVKVTDCVTLPDTHDVRFQQHWVYGQCRDFSSFCRVSIQVPSDRIVHASIEHVRTPEASGHIHTSHAQHDWRLYVYENSTCSYCDTIELRYRILRHSILHYLASKNQLYVYYQNHPPVRVTFEAVESRLDIRYTSDHSGFVTAWYEAGMGTVCDQLKVPVNHVIMISYDSAYMSLCSAALILHYVASDSGNKITDELITYRHKFIKIYRTTQLDVCVDMTGEDMFRKSCFKLLFSFHPEYRVPQRLSGHLFNCSVDDYWSFKEHLDCNMQVNCEDGQDESGHCPYSSPACGGWVRAHHKCYQLFHFDSVSTFPRTYICRALGYEMASIKTERELHGAMTLLRGRGGEACLGLTCGQISKRSLYGWVYLWSDNTAVYNTNHIKVGRSNCDRVRGYMIYFIKTMHIFPAFHKCKAVMCEKNAEQEDAVVSKTVQFSLVSKPRISFQQFKHGLVICAEGHVTHAFLSCDLKSRCGQSKCNFYKETRLVVEVISATHHSVDTVAMYSCSSVDTELSYSLLCDFRQDCADNSDESFCHHPACTQFTCTSGQCVAMDKRCDLQMDCLDDSDEKDCPVSQKPFFNNEKQYQNQNLSYVINFDGRGYFSQRVMNITDPCPDTHYRCTREWFYCLPVYTRCNGVFDCVFQEDERDCENWTRPGLYRCRDSTVCVHADHMCDGWPQCPQRDDEWLCKMTCPAQCLCQGHAFLCLQPFSPVLFPQLRYLDARGSGMTPSALGNNTYIVRLSLAQCSIDFLPDMKFPNLKFLDLSFNQIRSVLMNVFTALPTLQILVLKGNPLTAVTVNPSNTWQTMLRKIDMSESHLAVFDSKILSRTPAIRYINISFSATHTLETYFHQTVPHLEELDVRGTLVNELSTDLFRGLNHLANVYASDYRFCCNKILPNIAPKPRCLAPDHYLSSCEDLLQSEVYRLNFWVVALLAGLGNIFCVVCHCVKTFITIPYEGPILVFMVSLQCADFCMGIYATVVTAAHQTFRGEYLHHEGTWRYSVACKVAGFLSQLSSEVSLVTIFLLSLVHLTTLCFPLGTYRFNKRSAVLTSGATWFVGILLACMPLLPELEHFGHYGQTALCILMLCNERQSNTDFYFLQTAYIFNLLFCILVCITQIIVFRATPRHRVLIDPMKSPVSASVNLLMRTAVTAVVRWISIIATSLLSFVSETGQDLNVFIAVMVLPFSSAVNPVLCLWHAVAYKRRQKQEERLLRLLKSKRSCSSKMSATN